MCSAIDNVTVSGHHQTMKHVKVSELKAKLSAHLAEVRNGETVVVCDRNTPIARLVPVDEPGSEGLRIEPAKGPLPPLRALPKVRLRRKIDVVALLRESRDQR
jgi:prevent-host-death family protein